MKNMSTKGLSKQFLVGFDHSQGDIPVIVIAEKSKAGLSVINAFKGDEAVELYHRLCNNDPNEADKTILKK